MYGAAWRDARGTGAAPLGYTSGMRLELAAFRPHHSATVLSWVTSAEEAHAWASLADVPAAPGVFERWHAGAWAHPFVGMLDGRPVAYGEVWEDDGDAELARLLVAPTRRGEGLGRQLAGLLAAEAQRRGLGTVWLRVLPDNGPALRCYEAAGFVRAAAEDEREFNSGQPRRYVWMRAGQIDCGGTASSA